jgi:RNA polymerase primary sigma factor
MNMHLGSTEVPIVVDPHESFEPVPGGVVELDFALDGTAVAVREAAGTPEPDTDMGGADQATQAEESDGGSEAREVSYDKYGGPSDDPVKDYMRQIGKVPLLNAAQEVDLAKRIEAGVFAQEKLDIVESMDPRLRGELELIAEDGRHSKNHLLEANLRLVVSLAKRYAGRGMPLLDLIQEGSLGLIRAVEKFDYAKGYKFSTYATWWIRQTMSRALADQARTIRIPVHVVEQVNNFQKTWRELLAKSNHDPTVDEVAHEMGITPGKAAELAQLGREPISFSLLLGDEPGDSELGDLIVDAESSEPIDQITPSLLRDALVAVLGELGEREQRVIEARFGFNDGDPKTLDEIGREFGVTRERIRQIETKALGKLRTRSNKRGLSPFLS